MDKDLKKSSWRERVKDKSFTHKVYACVILGTNLLCAEGMRRNGVKYE